MAEINLSKYGITGTTEIVYNPSYEMLFEEETKPELEGFEKGQESELGAVNVMTGVYTGRSPKDKFIVVDENHQDLCLHIFGMIRINTVFRCKKNKIHQCCLSVIFKFCDSICSSEGNLEKSEYGNRLSKKL